MLKNMERQPNISSGLSPEQRAAEIADLRRFIDERETANRQEEELSGVKKSAPDEDLRSARKKLNELIDEEEREKNN